MSDQIRASHILVSHAEASGAASQLTKEDALAQIENLKTQLEAGRDFSDLAKEFSDCPSSGQGGDLGSFSRGAMVPAFDQAAFDLEINAVSEVVETEFGYHLIHRTE